MPALQSLDSADPPTSVSLIGIGVAVAGNILISLALNLQKLAHRRLTRVQRGSNDVGKSNGIGVLHEEDEGEGEEMETERGGDAVVDLAEDTPARAPRIVIAPDTTPSRTPTAYKLASPQPFPTDRLLQSDSYFHTHSPTPPPRRYGSLPSPHPAPPEEQKTYLKSKLWWAGLLVMTIGETGNFLSYAYAPASVVAPLGTVALIANCLFAPLLLGERLRRLELFGVALAIVGAITVVAAGNPKDIRLSPDGLLTALSQPGFIAYTVTYAVAASALVFLSGRPVGERIILIDVGLCALFGGFTVLATKALSSMLTLSGPVIFTAWITYPVIFVLASTAILQIRYLNRALQRFDSKIVVPTQFTLFNLSAILGSAVLYHDFAHVSFHRFVVFLYGIATTFAGVFCLTYRPRTFFSPENAQQPPQDPSLPNSPIGQPPLPPAVLHTRQSAASLGLSPGKYLLIATADPHDGGEDAPAAVLPIAFGRGRRVSTSAVSPLGGPGQVHGTRPALWRPASAH